jgi:hypothetical protein
MINVTRTCTAGALAGARAAAARSRSIGPLSSVRVV